MKINNQYLNLRMDHFHSVGDVEWTMFSRTVIVHILAVYVASR